MDCFKILNEKFWNVCKNLTMLISSLILVSISGCVTFAPPSPMVTFGGPKTTPLGVSETALALGTGASLFDDSHTGGMGWFGRYKYGLGDNFDLGVDALGVAYSDNASFTAKFAGRYRLKPQLRLEGGLGAADDSNGKSLNSDIGLTLGTIREGAPWNFYSSARIGYALGLAGNSVFSTSSDPEDTIVPPNTGFTMLNLGAQGRISMSQDFVFEVGLGGIYPKGEAPGMLIYISCGMLFWIGKE